MASDFRVGDFGAVLTFTFKDEGDEIVPLDGLTTREIIFRKPDRTVVSKTPTLVGDGTGGQVTYTVASGDFNVKGRWEVQGRAANNSNNFYSDVHQFQVLNNIE